MYMPDTKGNVFAFDAVTGERLWFYKPKYPKGFASGLPTSRGVVIGDGKVFMAQTDGNIVGLDQSTGRVVWKTNAGDYKQGYFFTSPPTYYNGTLIIGQSGGDFGARCKVLGARREDRQDQVALQRDPGRQGVRRQHVAEEAGVPRRRRRLGPADRRSALGLVYIGVGNPVPYNGISARQGQGALHRVRRRPQRQHRQVRWHYQEVHHDIWDYDTAANPLVLFDLTIKGQPRKALASMGKTGWVYILDRRNGKPILGIPERKVPQKRAQHT